MRISFDLDDILASFQKGWIEFNNTVYGTKYVEEDFTDFHYTKVMNISEEEVLKRIFEFYYSNIFENLIPVPGALDIVESLSKEHELFVLTSRPEEVLDLTRYWIRTNYDSLFQDIFTSAQIQRDGFNTAKISKAEICTMHNIDVHIEDSPIYAMDTANAGIKTILVSKPWNAMLTEPHDKIVRVANISEIPSAL